MHDNIEDMLIKKAVKQDIKAFESLVCQYEKKVYNICFRYMHNEEDAKDLAQEVFIKLYKNISSFNFTSSFSTWLYRIACNTCIDEIRKRKKRQTISLDNEENGEAAQLKDPALGPEARMIEKTGLKDIKAAISLLDESYKTVIILREIQGLSYQEIADITESSLGTVKSRLARARRILQDLLFRGREQNPEEIV